MWSIANRTPSTDMIIVAALLALHLSVPGSVHAQSETGTQRSTVDRRTALREAKMNDLESPMQTALETGLNWVETNRVLQRLRHGWKGFHPVLGGFPSGSGQAFGIEWRKKGLGTRYPSETSRNRVDLLVTGAASLRGYYLLKTEGALRNVLGQPFNVSGVAAYRRNAQEDFYGFGQDSLAGNRTDYLLEAGGAGGVLWWREPVWLSIGSAIGWVDFNVGPGTDRRHPITERVFEVDQVPGLTEQGAFIRSDAFVEIDWRNEGNPYRGGFYGLRWSDWRDQALDRFSFSQYEIDLQQYLPLAGGTRVIAVRARSVLSEAEDGQQVPFYLMPTLGGNNELRGVDYARFTDLNSILFQAEYRAEVWMAMDLALFIDAGRVAADRADLFDQLEVNYGFGLRLKTAESTFQRIDFAFGGESFRAAFTFDNVFDDLPLYRSVAKPR